jgi:peptidoglycan/xylan/chitin deacetylase (PgdA/CDA1 family)
MGNITIIFRKLFNAVKPLIRSTLFICASLPLVKQALGFWRGPCAIFCMHRVLTNEQINSDKSPNSSLGLTEKRFSEILKFLSSRYQMISLDELGEHLQNGSSEKVACLTFDDGYRDNIDHALPILEQFNCPATIFITTRFPEGDTWIWWFELWDYLQSKERLEMEFEGTHSIWDCTDKVQKHRCYLDLSSWMMRLSLERQKSLLTAVTKTRERRTYSNICLDWNDIIKLDRHPLITIGAHTHSHPNLARETEKVAREEILNSKLLLERKLGHAVNHFAYPFGTSTESGLREYLLAEECGFSTASTTRCFPADYSHRLQLPRYGITKRTTIATLENRIGGLSNILGLQLG